jgi:hypothetical protein
MASIAHVRRICLSLPGTTEEPYERLPGFRVKDKLFARIRQKPDALVVFTPSVKHKEELIAAEPKTYFQTPHYEGHPAVLVRLPAIGVAELKQLLVQAWTLRAPDRLVLEAEGQAAAKKPKRKPRK